MAVAIDTANMNQNQQANAKKFIEQPQLTKIVGIVTTMYQWLKPTVFLTSEQSSNQLYDDSVFLPTTLSKLPPSTSKNVSRRLTLQAVDEVLRGDIAYFLVDLLVSELHYAEARELNVACNCSKINQKVNAKSSREIWRTVIYPTSNFYLFWLTVLTATITYNAIGLTVFIFDDIQKNFFHLWLASNIAADLVFIVDILIQSRKTYTINGEYEKDIKKVLKEYFRSPLFWIDVLAVAPIDLFLIKDSRLSFLRVNRLLKSHRIFDFVERALMKTQFPNSFKISIIIAICFVLFHWNACAYFYISLITDSDINDRNSWIFTYTKNADPVLPNCSINGDVYDENYCWFNESGRDARDRESYVEELAAYWRSKSRKILFSNFSKEYSLSFYWSSLTLTTKGQQPYPTDSEQNWLEIINTLIGVLVFAIIVGFVGGTVLQMNQKQSDFQQLLDGIKFYMNYRNVIPDIQKRVIDCCGYVRDQNIIQQNENKILESLPTRLEGQIAVQLHMNTIKHDCEPGLLYELLLRLKYQLFSPGDYLCRRGELAREMYIIERGRLHCVSDDGKEIYKVLKEGDVIGQLAILNLTGDKNENKRDVAVCSAAYTDVYILRQDDVAKVLQDYPEERKKIIRKGIELLCMDHLYDSEKASAARDEWKMFSKEEQLTVINNFLDRTDRQLSHMYEDFNALTLTLKQRLTKMELLIQNKIFNDDSDDAFEYDENDLDV
uniref:Cyclic nucleotide-binding domain-containing protein n=1 Tax=Syphacia muris TaxID=451379 RepID=A0A0N5AUU8_9BILA